MRQRNLVTVFGLLCILGAMVTLVAYSVPLYELFCRVTGYGGTTQVAEASGRVIDRTITIRFNADRADDLPWRFVPQQTSMVVRVGEPNLALYRAESKSDETVTGTATFNVMPAKAGLYFNKIDCFCFTEQVLAAGEVADLPVQFFVDPAIADDPNLDDVTTITLSYTFFRSVDQTAEARSASRNAAATRQTVN